MKFIFAFFLIFSFPTYAEEEKAPEPIVIPTADFSELKHTKSGRIDKVIDGLTILMKDKTIIRLASLDIPDFHSQRHAPYSEEALKLLQNTLPTGTEVLLYQTRKNKTGRENRMGHALGHIVTKKEPIWINGAFLSHGIARTIIAANAVEMSAQLLKAEQQARTHKRGIWSKGSDYLVLTPDTAAQAMGQYAIIEGIVQKTASIRNNVYLNFGENWKTDFTIMITPTIRKKLAQQGIHPLSLSGETVRVRGWAREYNGPLIELDVPEHLELIPQKSEQVDGEDNKEES